MGRLGTYIAVTILAAFAIVATTLSDASAQTFNVGANFTTQTYAANTGEPPDTMGAAGPNHFIAFNNDGFSIFDKGGALVSRISPTSFWTSALGSNPGGLSDPRILFDPMSQRWFAVMITTDQSTNNKILFARSNTADPTQGFKGVSYTTTNSRFADFPTLGLDANGVYVGTNNFTAGGSFSSVGLYSAPKADLLADPPTLARATKFPTLSASTVGFTLQPAVNYGPKSAGDPAPILATNNSSATRYNFTPLSGAASSGATLGSTIVKTVQSFSAPTASAQPGTSIKIDNGEDNISGNVVQVGNFLYAVQGTTVSSRTAVRWTIANATTFAIVQQGTISSPTLSYFFPSVAVNAAGDVVVGFSGSNASTFGSTYAVVGASAGGAPGGSITFGAPVQTKAGVDFYDGTRWGDYSATTPDPADPGIFWTHQEYATTRTAASNNWNWATQASEIIPTKASERRWSNQAGGSFATGANYFVGVAPLPADHVIFSRPNASYSVAFTGDAVSDRASIRQGNVTWDLSAGSYSLTNANVAAPALTIAEFQGTASLTLAGGSVNATRTLIAPAAGSGALTVEAGATLTNDHQLVVGAQGAATLTIENQGAVYIGDDLAIGAQGTVNLNGGSLRFDGYSRSGTISYTAGTVALAGDRTIGTDAAVQDFFGALPNMPANKTLAVEGTATLTAAAPLTLSGGTLSAQSLIMPAGAALTSTQTSTVSAAIQIQNGADVDAAAGELTLGNAADAAGFHSAGALHVNANQVTLVDADAAVFDASSVTTLGSAGVGGTLAAANGITLNIGGVLMGHGAIETPVDSTKPLLNNGAITGDSLAEPLTLSGSATGVGKFDNVDFAGEFSPGAGPVQLDLGSAAYDGTLDLEIGGLTAGSDFDQLNHILGDGLADLGGTLAVTLLNAFSPAAGDSFEILTATGGVTGTFTSTMLPLLADGLAWNLVYGTSDVLLQVVSSAPPLPADFNEDGAVDAADLAAWTSSFGIAEAATRQQGDANADGAVDGADLLVWQQQLGSLSAATAVAVPEPPAAFLVLLAVAHGASHIRRKS